ncbi:unnamed protein product [Ixodes pacificus]
MRSEYAQWSVRGLVCALAAEPRYQKRRALLCYVFHVTRPEQFQCKLEHCCIGWSEPIFFF